MSRITLITLFTALYFNSLNAQSIKSYEFQINSSDVRITVSGCKDLVLEGTWNKGPYNKVACLQFFENRNNEFFAFSARKYAKFGLFKEGMSSKEFLNSFYNTDSSFISASGSAVIKTVEKTNNYIIFKMTTRENENFMLYGVKGKSAIMIQVGGPDYNKGKSKLTLLNIFNKIEVLKNDVIGYYSYSLENKKLFIQGDNLHSFSLDGKWEKSFYLESNMQQVFKNNSNDNLSISVLSINSYKHISKPGFKGVLQHFKWEKKFHKKTTKLEAETLFINEKESFLIYKLNAKTPNYHLIYRIGDLIYNVSIVSLNMQEQEKVKYLQNIAKQLK
ncbi:MAG: hypothetical protein ACJ0QJ_01180 [Flavobacteriales bacterium]